MKPDFKGLAEALLPRIREYCIRLLPGGKVVGHEYVCAGIRGGDGRSLSVNVNTGMWADFAADIKGGDVISLYAAVNQVSQMEAAKTLATESAYQLIPPPKEVLSPGDVKTGKPPKSAPEPDFKHHEFGHPSYKWAYRDEKGSVLFWVARYDPAERKQFIPFTWDLKASMWRHRMWPSPRPLYGLDRLYERSDAPVLIVEGEKAADAAFNLLGHIYVIISWSGGAVAWDKTDWSHLRERSVLLWPDADRHVAKTKAQASKYNIGDGEIIPYPFQPGPKAMEGIAQTICHYAQSVKIINVGIDEELPDGWDAANAVAEGWLYDSWFLWAKSRAAVYVPPPPPPEPPKPAPVAKAVEVQVMPKEAPVSAQAAPEAPDSSGAVSGTVLAEWERLGIAPGKNGSVPCNVDNALRVIEGREEFKDLIWFDDFHKKLYTNFNFKTWEHGRRREWADIDDLDLVAFVQRHLGLRRMSDDVIHKAAIVHAHRNIKNEPRDWFESLKWDEKPRINTFFADFMGAEDSDYTRAASQNFWKGMVARIYRPGCQLDNMIVLESPQGIGKTNSLRAIGGDWYCEAHESVQSKDFFLALHGRLIVEIAEMSAFRKAEVTKIKQIITCKTDRYRAPYERSTADHPRMSVFAGSTNEKVYLHDMTGGRRFWPIDCMPTAWRAIEDKREQLFAEAVARFKAGESWYEMPASTKAIQESRRHVDEWENIIAGIVERKESITMSEIAYFLKIDAAHLDILIQRRIATIMTAMGWDRGNFESEGRTQIGWTRPKLC